ncbi:MAG TPA: DegT/DnrJ/EryC1/StrS family aminotransferase [Candidatus Binataceae bacterium]|nr:DegT/DnrJ/EryC1/StrS family aminotransferase [Candidatus Binataceae bacterium]
METAKNVVPLADLKAQYHSIKGEIDRAISGVLESSQFILGKEVAAFEEEFAAYSGAKHGIGVNTGTSALHLSLLAAGVGPGDEVITVPFTFVATVAAILYTGATPVYVDIDPKFYTMDPAKLERAISPRTKAIIPVHLYGQPADMDPIMEIARRNKKVVIEDACQAHGAEYKGRRAGSIGEMGCFSFYPGKNLGAYGEGGAVVTSNPEYAKIIRMLRDWGQARRYYHDLRGFNNRLEGIQGAILRVKLRHLEKWTEARRACAREYIRLMDKADAWLPSEMPHTRHVFHVFALRVPQRDLFAQELADAGVQTGIHYPIPVHLQPAYREPRYKEGDFPVSEAVASEELSIPIFPEITKQQIQAVSAAVKSRLARPGDMRIASN